MASKTTLNAKNLETLGAAALADLLIEISTGSAAAKRRLRLALAGGQGAKEAAAEIRKRLAAIRKARARVGYRQRKALAEDLSAQVRAIVEQVAPSQPTEALDLLWQFLGLANSVFDRCDDGSGTVIGIFREACSRLGPLAQAAETSPDRLADRVLDALIENDYGQFDHLVADMAEALGAEGLASLKERVLALEDVAVPPKAEWQRVGIGSGGVVYAHQLASRQRRRMIDSALQDIADAQGDVDAFIARYNDQARQMPEVAAEIAARLIAAGRAAEALAALDAARAQDKRWIPDAWHEARLTALEALGRHEDAQAHRWASFAQTLSIPHLRAYLKRLPDFADIEAEERAMAHAAAFPDAVLALWFLVNWPSLPRASALVLARARELDGDHYEVLTPAAEALSQNWPLAAVLTYRAMIDFALTHGRSGRYGHAARHLQDCARLEPMIEDHGAVEPHAAYVARLKAQHGRKTSFWQAM
ncbi:hypothetical protein GC209_16145 [bacterium]|nr:hypothetical protein [bacterium]